MMAFRPFALLLALVVLSSCAYGPDNLGFSRAQCTQISSAPLQGVDWLKARRLSLRIRQGEYLPTYVGMQMNQSYVLEIENADEGNRSFRALEFFNAIAVAGVNIAGAGFQDVDCLGGVTIPAGQKTEIRFVAVRDGTYEFDDNSLMVSLAMIGSSGGFITIEPPKTYVQSPLKHLELVKRAALVSEPEETSPTGLFDDQEETLEEAPMGLFGDQEETPDEAPTGLFDDQEETPETAPSGLFDTPEQEQPIEAAPAIPVEEAPTPELFQDESEPPAPVAEKSLAQPVEEEIFVDTEPEPELEPEPEPQQTGPVLPPVELFVEEEFAPAQDGPPADIFSDPPDVVNTPPGGSGQGGNDTFSGSG